ncbi:VOC family protein [Pseudoalteromonas sp. S16_S37]|uniref:VOC family protein n=1 Tax=Pseudoalteromonas sp. S16_S37 TaxID=2720228 RepID=UPI00237B30AA|nr:VOC family protein [Pseudoalteromonas sp. S16_S37]MBD1584187.1 VOC family protein [Pseudoalteromonas sp. S16_S37]
MATPAIPEGYHSITPYLIVDGAVHAIMFYQQAFNAQLVIQLPLPDGGIAHAELKIGDSHIMLSDKCAEVHFDDPHSLGGTPVSLMLYVDDVDSKFANALALGGKEIRPVHDQFYGDRAGTLEDPFGHVWTIATHKEDLSSEQIMQAMEEVMSKQQDG